jgi:peptide/nickel transport system substrate-binding protein
LKLWIRPCGWRPITLFIATGLLLSACGAATSPSAPHSGGTVTFAEGPGLTPNYILPLESGSYFGINNGAQFSQMMYLPLYWFGDKGEPVLNETLSVARPPVFSDNNTVATIDLKHWRWSDGAPITARDVIFWLNLLSAVTDPAAPTIGSSSAPGPGWGAEVPGGFPTNVVSYAQTGTYSLVLHLNASYNPTWYTYNELSQIYPMPQQSWDRLSASGPVGNYDASAQPRTLATASDGLPANSYVPSNPGSATGGALGVAQFLNLQSQDLGTYQTNPLWQVVDGPFKLSQFSNSGFVKLVPNRAYSGSPKPVISAFEELPFTSDTAEFDALHSGQLTIGYLPIEDLSQRSALEKQGYSYNTWFDSEDFFLNFNFTNPTTGPILDQLYFRQAFQSLINQPQYIKDFMGGIGTINNGPVPSYPPNNPNESPLEAHGQVYPYDPARAVSLLKAHGWAVRPGGVSYCASPGSASDECGPGVKQGAKAAFSVLYPSGSIETSNEMEAMASTMASHAGIQLRLEQQTESTLIGSLFNGCTPSTPCSSWSIGTYEGWTYSPDYLPTGGELFATGSGSNAGDYSNPVNDANIEATHTAPTAKAEYAALFKYEDFLARQLPVAWMPNGPQQLTMYRSTLHGLVPQGVFVELYPQLYYFS